jgi:hypothetical protein
MICQISDKLIMFQFPVLIIIMLILEMKKMKINQEIISNKTQICDWLKEIIYLKSNKKI